MANMGYCRFRNTLRDLRECSDALDSGGQLSDEEASAAKSLIRLCVEIAENHGDRVGKDVTVEDCDAVGFDDLVEDESEEA